MNQIPTSLTTKLLKLSLIINELDLKDYVVFDICLARGLDYYTGLLFEAVLLNKELIGTTIASGGRYNKVIEKFSSKKGINAIGVSFGLERIIHIKKAMDAKISLPVINIYVASVGKGMLVNR
jgi:histidyl-tRNA synthetase